MRRTGALDFLGEHYTDVLIRMDNKLVVAWNVADLHAFACVTDYAHDFDVLKGGAPNGYADAAVFVNGGGVRRAWFNKNTNKFVKNLLEGTAWQNARSVRSAYLDGSSNASLIGISSDGGTLLRLDDPGGTNSLTTISLPHSNAEIVMALEWDGQSGSEYVYSRTDSGLVVVDGQGLLLKSVSAYNTPPFTVIPEVGYGHDRIVAVAEPAQTNVQYLLTYDDNYTDPLTHLGAVNVQGIAAGDGGLNGHLGVILSHQFDWQLFRADNDHVNNAPPSPAFPISGMSAFPLSVFMVPTDPAPTNQGQPTYCDIDNDNDPDFVSPLQNEAGLGIDRNTLVDDEDHMVKFVSGDYSGGVLSVTFNEPLVSQSYDTLSVIVFSQADYETPPSSTAVLSQDVAITSTGWPYTVNLQLDETICTSDRIFSVLTRIENQVGNASYPAWASPTHKFVFSTNPGAISLFLNHLGYDEVDLGVTGLASCPQDDGSGSSIIPLVDCMVDETEEGDDVIIKRDP
jgi:hypothetical protein